MASQKFKAVEDYASVLEASDAFAATFGIGGERRPGMGSEILWLPKLVVWGHFGSWKTKIR